MNSERERDLLAQKAVVQEKLNVLYVQQTDIKKDIELLQREHERIYKLLADPAGASGLRSGMNDTLAVPTSDLRKVIQDWIDSFGEGAVSTLARRSGLSARMIRKIKSPKSIGSSKFTTYTVAEKLLYAMGREEAVSNGEVAVVPNPRLALSALSPYYEE